MSMSLFSLLFVATLAASPAEPPRQAVRAEARATVRIMRGERIGWGRRDHPRGARITQIDYRPAQGKPQPARFVEFE